MNKIEARFLRACEKFQLNPSRWVPHLKLEGLYEMGTAYDSAEQMIGPDGKLGEGAPVPIEVFSAYSALETVCRERRKKRNGKGVDDWPLGNPGFWEELWGFLSEVDMGIFDTTAWVAVGEPYDGIERYHHRR